MNYQKYYSFLTKEEKKHFPKELFLSGNEELLYDKRRIAIVGSRKASSQGLARAEVISKALVENDIIVVSGLALGIDTKAHQTAIKYGGKTISVLGTPLDNVYPKQNSALLEEIKTNHLALSQFPSGYPTQPKNFPVRNRTMALISDATIIIEATENSGTRHQGWEALRLGREVYILENIIKNESVKWAKEMLEYGAQILTRENLANVLESIPYLTSKTDYAF